MASVQDRLKLKRESVDTWSTREQLCLASSVLKSGDQNWISVSRSLRPFAEKEALRPPDWFSQKSCAIQYAILLENADTPKRKKRESGETTGESIVRRLTQERIAELQQILAFQRDEYRQLKNEVNLLKSGNVSDEKLQKMWQAIEQEEREAEQKARAHAAWLAKRQQKSEPQNAHGASPTPRKTLETPAEAPELQELQPETEDDRKNRGGRSPLLTSLLKSPSPTTQIQNPPSTAQTTSPTIASLLGATTKSPSPQISTVASPQIHHLVTSTLAPSVPERPSAGAPTLSMLLELPCNLARSGLAHMQGNQGTLNDSTRKISNHVASSVGAGSVPVTESMVQIIDHIDDVIGKDKMPEVIDKDEINEIIGDIEELIKEEITKSPKTVEGTGIIEPIPAPPVEPKVREVDETASSNSPHSEMAIEEIDQSTSNIAEIIGTAIETEPKVIVEALHPQAPEVEEKSEAPTSMAVDEEKEPEPKEEEEEEEEEEEKKKKIEPEEKEIEAKPEEDTVEVKAESEEVTEASEPEVKSPQVEVEVEPDEDKPEEEKMEEVPEEKEDPEPVVEDKVEEVAPEVVEEKEDVKEEVEEKNEEKTEAMEEVEKAIEEEEEEEEEEEDKKEDEKNVAVVEHSSQEEEKPEATQEKPVDAEKCPETSQIKDEPVKESESKPATPGESEKAKSPEENKEPEEPKDEKPKEEELSPKNDANEELEPPVLPSQLEEPVDKPEDPEEAKPEVDTKEPETEPKPETKEIKEEPVEEKMEESKPEDKEPKVEKEEAKKDEDVKKEEAPASAADDTEVEEEESSLAKLPARSMKTYSKKQNAAVDSEPETETDNPDYRAWKKSILLHYSRLATHKYASLFLRPITEDHAPGYHSVVFRPMDLSTIKKNIDNGTIRTNMQFQRDVMLMFQNAIMYNKSDSFVYKMAVSMQEECLQSMQILVEATGEGAYRRETRTAASSSSETSESSIVKRKRSLVTPSPLDTDSPRLKKRRKSEND